MSLISDINSNQWSLSVKGGGEIVQGLEDIKQSVYLILTTERGTDPLRLDFGCGVNLYIDLPSSKAVPKMINEIKLSLEKWEPRIDNIKVSQIQDMELISFSISYKIKNTVSTDQINITYG